MEQGVHDPMQDELAQFDQSKTAGLSSAESSPISSKSNDLRAILRENQVDCPRSSAKLSLPALQRCIETGQYSE
jgi:hypothetical protein